MGYVKSGQNFLKKTPTEKRKKKKRERLLRKQIIAYMRFEHMEIINKLASKLSDPSIQKSSNKSLHFILWLKLL